MTTHNVAYTTPAAGENLLEGYNVAISPRWRKLMKIGFIGGAAIADGEIQIQVGSKIIGDIFNCAITDTILPEHIFPVGGEFIPPYTPLSVVVIASTGADNYTLYLDIKDM